jgi:hypothetical protein
MDTYGHLFEGSDRDSLENMEKLLGGEPTASNLLTCLIRTDKTGDKNSKARIARAAK